MAAYVMEKLCLGCQRCVDACPNRAIRVFARLAIVNPAKCSECEECIGTCMHGAITLREDTGVGARNDEKNLERLERLIK